MKNFNMFLSLVLIALTIIGVYAIASVNVFAGLLAVIIFGFGVLIGVIEW